MDNIEHISLLAKTTLHEDLGTGDITAQIIPEHYQASANIISNEDMILCGVAWADQVFALCDPNIDICWKYNDGDQVNKNSVLCEIKGSSRHILTAERSALNLLQTLSATATITAKYVKKLKKLSLLDTRKTIPGLRFAQKYATKIGGATNHRLGLYDAFLIKENQILACGSIAQAVAKARKLKPKLKIEVEVENLSELKSALATDCEMIMLDNFTVEEIKQAVALNQKQCLLEISGNVNLNNISQYDNLGADFISVGALTKDIKSIDLSLRLN